ncbi:amino acid permease [Amycolatopsis sp. NPDC051372]|uniref:amino acid permease n=1 Tax=Amycolatopsis sp. NPDC051372 TaxID=3155669 RepID=UPI0034174CB0
MPPEPALAESTTTGTAAPRELTRSIGVTGGTLLTLSCVTPASSLFVLVPPLFADLGTGTAPAIALAVLLCVGIAFCYSELGTLVPSAGGEYAIVTTVLNRFSGWITFVLSFIVILVVPPIIALGVADYLAPIVHLDPSPAGAAVMLASTVMGVRHRVLHELGDDQAGVVAQVRYPPVRALLPHEPSRVRRRPR